MIEESSRRVYAHVIMGFVNLFSFFVIYLLALS